MTRFKSVAQLSSAVSCLPLVLVLMGSAYAQDSSGMLQDVAEDVADDLDVITVTATRPAGMTVGDIEPELTLTTEEIESYGVSSLGELLQELEAETGSGRGRSNGPPVVLLNGQRISGFREIREYPPEALARVEVLPEEVALKYGYSADQRVINFVLKPNVRILAVEVEAETPTAGDRVTTEGSVRHLFVNDDRRWSVDAKKVDSTSLLESERDILTDTTGTPYSLSGNIGSSPFGDPINAALGQTGSDILVAGVLPSAADGSPTLADFQGGNAILTDQAPFRTLAPDSVNTEIGFSYSRPLFGERPATFSGRLENTESTSKAGLPIVAIGLPSSNPYSPFAEDVSIYRYADGFGPLLQQSDVTTSNLGFSLTGNPGDWNWVWTASATQTESNGTSDINLDLTGLQAAIDAGDVTVNPFGSLSSLSMQQQRTESTSKMAQTEVTTNGGLFMLPAGEATATFKAGAETSSLKSRSISSQGDVSADLSRDIFDGQVNVDFPILTDDDDSFSALGSLSVNANFAQKNLSDFDDVTTLGWGVNWQPVRPLRFLVSFTEEDGAPSMSQLGDPVNVLQNVRVFDFVTGQTVFVEATTGGVPNLKADHRSVFKLGTRIEPFEETRFSINVDYTDTVIDDPVGNFPSVTPTIEAAFPSRFTRDASGTLIAIDRRPVNFAQRTDRQLRTGISFMKQLGGNDRPSFGGGPPGGRPPGAPGGQPPNGQRPPGAPPAQGSADGRPPQGQDGAQRQPNGEAPARPGAPDGQRPGSEGNQAEGQGRPPGGQQGGPPRGGRPGGGGGGGFGGGRPGGYRVSLNHVWYLEQTIDIADGVPTLDLLNGDTLGNGGGQSEHGLELGFNLWNKGLWMRSEVSWQSGTTVTASPLSSTGDLEFSDLTIAEMRVGYNLDTKPGWVAKHPWLKGMRVSFDVENIFDQKQDVRDANGNVPITYQPDLIDPIGRTVEFEIRKRF